METWRSIPGYPLYMASSLGRIKRLGYTTSNNRKIPESICKQHLVNGYPSVNIVRPKKRIVSVHILVALAFLGEKPGEEYQVCHKDDIKTNNTPANLKWATPAENSQDAIRNGRYVNGMKVKTHCKMGHYLNGEDVTITSKGYRVCRKCKRLGNKRFYERHGPEYYRKYK